jgi:hypothetical protein
LPLNKDASGTDQDVPYRRTSLPTSHHVDVDERRVWAIKVFIEATEEQADEAVRAIGGALCPEENHPGYCQVPWATVLIPPDSLDPDELAEWSQSFAEDRERARSAGETGA